MVLIYLFILGLYIFVINKIKSYVGKIELMKIMV